MKHVRLKSIFILLLATVAIGVAYSPLSSLLKDTQLSDRYSHIPLIPVISAYFFFRKRKDVFQGDDLYNFPGIFFMAAGMALFFLGMARHPNLNDAATIATLSALVFVVGSFLFLYGKKALRTAAFPFAFLIFAVPIPSILLERIISGLVAASMSITFWLFKLIGVDFTRDGSIFHLPGFSIEVAKVCSGIRSSLALLITTILAGHLFLRKFWKKTVFALAVIPVAIFKNGLRIVSLYLLSYYVDMRFIEGDFHHKFGGAVFFGLGLALMGVILWFLMRSEGSRSKDMGKAAPPMNSA
jgi:exosortase